MANSSKITRQVITKFQLLALTGTAQIIVQFFGFACGILIIRCLPTHEYALYTLANTMLGCMTSLADSGVSVGVMSNGGKVWQDKDKLGKVLATGLQLRKRFAAISLTITTPLLFYLLNKHGASWLMSTMIAISLVPAFYTSLSTSLWEIAPKLHQDIKSLQKIQVTGNLARLVTLTISLLIFPLASVAIISAGISQLWINHKLKRISKRYVSDLNETDPKVQDEILKTVKKVIPGTIYYVVSGQLTIWLISIFGSTQAIAQIGAIGRLSVLLNIFGVMFGTLVIPRYARLPKNSPLILLRFGQIQLVALCICAAVILVVWLFPAEILSVLGKDYKTLQKELLLIILGACVGFLAGITYGLNAVRERIPPSSIILPVLIISQIAFIWTFKVDNVVMAAIFTFVIQLLVYVVHLSFGVYSMMKQNNLRKC